MEFKSRSTTAARVQVNCLSDPSELSKMATRLIVARPSHRETITQPSLWQKLRLLSLGLLQNRWKTCARPLLEDASKFREKLLTKAGQPQSVARTGRLISTRKLTLQ